MSVFAVIALRDQPGLAAEIEAAFPGGHARPVDNVWFIKSSEGVLDVAGKLGVGEDEDRRAGLVVVRCSPAYYGRADPWLWDWLLSAFRKPGAG